MKKHPYKNSHIFQYIFSVLQKLHCRKNKSSPINKIHTKNNNRTLLLSGAPSIRSCYIIRTFNLLCLIYIDQKSPVELLGDCDHRKTYVTTYITLLEWIEKRSIAISFILFYCDCCLFSFVNWNYKSVVVGKFVRKVQVTCSAIVKMLSIVYACFKLQLHRELRLKFFLFF